MATTTSRLAPFREYAGNSMPLAIRRLGPGDAPVLERLAREAPDFDLAGRSEPDPPLAPAAAETYLADPHVLHWVAEEDGVVLGELLCHLLPMPHGAGRELLLYSIGVRERARRRGVGRALVEEMRAWAQSAGVPEVWVLADNSEAEAFYEACGFRRGRDDEQGVMMLLDPAARV
jgi:ribosomal protein S18 acetylase RimI-like enzyme